MKMLENCPFFGIDDGKDCPVCHYFIIYPKLDNNNKISYICKLDCMKPGVVYIKHEPLMPWE